MKELHECTTNECAPRPTPVSYVALIDAIASIENTLCLLDELQNLIINRNTANAVVQISDKAECFKIMSLSQMLTDCPGIIYDLMDQCNKRIIDINSSLLLRGGNLE